MKKLILVANVAKEHVLKFHVPTIKRLVEEGWVVDVACGGKEVVPYCHHQYELPIDRSPFKTHLFKAVRQLRNIIESEEHDIVYCHTSVGATVARLAALKLRKRGVRVVNFAHGTYFYQGAPLHNWVLYYPLYKALSLVTDATVTITPEDFIFSKRHFRHSRVYYVEGIGIDPGRFPAIDQQMVRNAYREELSIPQDATVLIYCAELSRNKNQVFLLHVLAELLRQETGFYLILAGTDHSAGRCLSVAESLGVSQNVRFLGWRDDIVQLYAMSDICTASSIREGLGLNLIEAMVCEVPVVATSNSGHRAVITQGKNGMIVELGDVSGFAQQILDLARMPGLRETIIMNAKIESEKYFNDNVLTKIMAILEEQYGLRLQTD